MNMEPRVPLEPRFYHGMFVRAVVIADHMHRRPVSHLTIDLGEELLELFRPMPTMRRHDHGAVLYIQRSEKKLVVPCRK